MVSRKLADPHLSWRIIAEARFESARARLETCFGLLATVDQRGGLFDCRPSVQIDQLFGFDVTRERGTASRVVRSLREFASPDSKSIQPSLKPSTYRY